MSTEYNELGHRLMIYAMVAGWLGTVIFILLSAWFKTQKEKKMTVETMQELEGNPYAPFTTKFEQNCVWITTGLALISTISLCFAFRWWGLFGLLLIPLPCMFSEVFLKLERIVLKGKK